MTLEDQLSRSITNGLERVHPPPPDLHTVVRIGGRRRRRRQTGIVAASTVLLVYAGLVISQLVGDLRDSAAEIAPVGPLDYTDGLRAYASPDGGIWLGGRSFTRDDLGFIDTDAVATPYGMVFFDSDLRPLLLREDGTSVALGPEPESSPSSDFHPSAKADAERPLVAWAEPADGGVAIRLYDMAASSLVDNHEVACSDEECAAVVVDAVDRGLVFVRTTDGTNVWNPGGDDEAGWTSLAGPETVVADARNRTILYTGPAPQPGSVSPVDESWSFTEGPVDAQLSFDGGHLLNWSTLLRPTTEQGRPIQLDEGRNGLVFVTFDTDGSVLVAVGGNRGAAMYDCVLPAGTCTSLGTLPTRSGDPVFVGDDM